MAVCAASCASATHWWPAPSRIRSRYGTIRSGGSSACARTTPHHWQDILRADLQHAPMTLRVNTRKLSRADYLRAAGGTGHRGRPDRRIRRLSAPAAAGAAHSRLRRRPGVGAGCRGQMAAPLLLGDAAWAAVRAAARARRLRRARRQDGPSAGACRLPAHGARCRPGPLRAHRPDAGTAGPAGRGARRRCGAGRQTGGTAQLFDAILLDAPCTASGIVRRHPDVPWLRRASDVDAAGRRCRRACCAACGRCCDRAAGMLYCTCSVFRAEGDIQIQTFVEHNTDAALLPSPGHLRPHLAANGAAVPDNQDSDHDGFFYALLEKRAP